MHFVVSTFREQELHKESQFESVMILDVLGMFREQELHSENVSGRGVTI